MAPKHFSCDSEPRDESPITVQPERMCGLPRREPAHAKPAPRYRALGNTLLMVSVVVFCLFLNLGLCLSSHELGHPVRSTE